MIKKIMSLVLFTSMLIGAEGECPTSIMSDLQEAGSHVYQAGKHLLNGVKHTAQSVPPVIRAGEKCITNMLNFIERYPATTALTVAAMVGTVIYARLRWKEHCRSANIHRVHVHLR